MPPVIETKLRRPAVVDGALHRPRLIHGLPRPGCRFGLVVAPAGFGKTTLLSQWSETVDRPVSWIRIDHDDQDPSQFWRYVTEALRSTIAGEQRAVPPALDPSSDPVPWVIDALAAAEHGVILVLDDYHEVRSDQLDADLDRLLRYLPASSTLVISTRHDPNLSLARWRASEHFAEVRQHELRFDDDETRQWLEGHGIEATPEATGVCLDVFQGWPAAYALALRTVAAAPEGAAFPAVRGHARHVAAYIREEVVGRDERESDVLLVAAVCPQVCGSLVDHVLDTTGSHRALEGLQGSGALLEDVGMRGRWFRLHRLVADYLLAEFDGHPKQQAVTERAAQWHAAHGQARVAFELFLAAGEPGPAADVLNRGWLREIHGGHRDRLRRNLARIEPCVAATRPSYLVTRAWLLAHEGRSREARSLLQRAVAVGDGGPLPDGAPSVEAAQAVMECLHLIDGCSSVLDSAAQADALVAPGSPWRPLADLAIGQAHYVMGDLETASAAFDRALATPSKPIRTLAIGWSAVIDASLGHHASARARLAETCQEWADEPALGSLPPVVVATAELASVEGRLFEAVHQLEACLERLGSNDPSGRLEVLLALSDAEASIGRSDRARRRLGEAEALARHIGGCDHLDERMAQIAARLGPGAQLLGRGPELTDREMRILQLLAATHLSQREIGRELGVSLNTVKTHVKAVYGKLGASSREEASQISRHRRLV